MDEYQSLMQKPDFKFNFTVQMAQMGAGNSLFSPRKRSWLRFEVWLYGGP
jgi:hypothetical protein